MRDSDIDSLSADGAQEPYPGERVMSSVYCGDNCNHTGPHHYPPAAHPAESAEALRAALKVLRGMSDELADGVLYGWRPEDVEDADWDAANESFRAALQASAPSPAAEPVYDEFPPGHLLHRAAAEGPTGPEPPPDEG